MSLFKRSEDESEKLFNSFAQSLEADGFSLIVLDKKKIKSAYGQSLYRLLANSLGESGFKNFLIIFDKKEPRISWSSDYHSDRVVVNLARGVGTPEFINAIQKAIIELQELEAAMKELSSKQI